ncbi:hypothetical protein [Lapidilactobacillus luobeiensis]|nr:hypothetical protein [Lapidilactobacillus luobeiensis]
MTKTDRFSDLTIITAEMAGEMPLFSHLSGGERRIYFSSGRALAKS